MLQNLRSFTLGSKNPSLEFSLLYSSSVISIKKIIIENLMDRKDEEWFCDLYNLHFYIEIKGKGKYEQGIDSPPFTFMGVAPVPPRPVFTFNHDFIFPEYNLGNESDTDFCKEVRLEIKPLRGKLDDSILLTLFYDATPGVAVKN
jgi:hypothetical protein